MAYPQANARQDVEVSGDVTRSDRLTRVGRTTAQTITTSTDTLLSVTVETEDNLACFDSGSPTVLTFPAEAYVHVTCWLIWGSNATGSRSLIIRQNGAMETGDTCDAAGTTNQLSSCAVDLHVAANDTVDFQVWQSSGGNLNVQQFDISVIAYYVP